MIQSGQWKTIAPAHAKTSQRRSALTLQLCWNVLYQQAGAWRNTYGRDRLTA
jgi:hypothetical protein